MWFKSHFFRSLKALILGTYKTYKMLDIYFRMTLNCNLECAHCYCSAGPGRESISIPDMKKVVDNMPYRLSRITLTGGEPFTRKRLLYSTLEYIQESHVNVSHVLVQTNGFWVKDDKQAMRTLEELTDRGVTDLDITSNDVWHREAGLDLSKPRLLGNIVEDMELGELRRKGRYKNFKGVFPMGRALDQDSRKWEYYENQGECWDNKKATIGIDELGRVYPCVLMVPGSELGDAKEEEIAKIVRNGRRRKPFNIVTSHDGARKLAWKAGMTNKEMKNNPLYSKGKRCGLCLYLFTEGLVENPKSNK